MAFPGTYNFTYYRGDTLEFNVYPKTTAGTPFSLADYTVSFNIATQRGLASENQINAYSAISSDKTHVQCAITPADGSQLSAGTPYVYDIEISYLLAPAYPKIYTLMTGDISVTEQITDIESVPITLPGTVTDLTVTEAPAGTVTVTWTAPTAGDLPTSYNIYGKADSLGVTSYVLVTNSASTSYSASAIFGSAFQSGVVYDIKVTSVNAAGENTTEFAEGSVTIA
jgi:hypothetical protein